MKSAAEYSRELVRKNTPKLSYNGSNLAQWQTVAREKLSEILGMDKFQRVDFDVITEYTKENNDYIEIRFTFQSEEGYRVPCHLLLPAGISKPPVMICLQGHSKGMHISLGRPKYEGDEATISGGDRDFCIRATKEGFAAVALEQRSFGECGGDENGPNCHDSAMASLLLGRTLIGERVWDVMRLIDVLETVFKDRINTDKICLMGNSGGGTATAYTAALEDRIKLAMPSCSMCTFRDSITVFTHCSCNYIPHIAEYFDMGDLMAMAYPKYFVQVSGAEDDGFLIHGAKEVFKKGIRAYKDQGAAQRCALVIGNGGHRFYADDAWPVVHNYISSND